MELLVMVALMGGLVALAVRYGYDSRDTYRSKEEELALCGLRWERDAQPRPQRPSSSVGWARVRLADAVVRLANWLDPTVVASAS